MAGVVIVVDDGEEEVPAFFFNIQGIIFYTTNIEYESTVRALKSLTAAAALVRSAQWVASLNYGPALETLDNLIPGLFNTGEAADGAEETAGLAIDGTLGALG